MIQLKQICKTWHSDAGPHLGLDNVSLDIHRGEIFGLIGRSGAGKSTVLRLINGLEQPSEGEVLVDGTPVHAATQAELRKLRSKIGMIFQHFNLMDTQTVYDNVALPLRLRGIDSKARHQKVDELLALTDLTQRQHAYPAQLSGGQKQRVAIARALATDCKILLCDEATSALDPETTQTILNLLKRLQQKLQLTIVLVTHEMAVVKRICDRAAILEDGKLVEMGNTFDLFLQPKTPQAKALIGSHLHHDLPEAIQHRIGLTQTPTEHPVLRIFFKEDTAAQPLISQIMTKFSISLNIVWANVETIQQRMLGIMVLTAHASPETLATVQAYFSKHGIVSEVLGYAQY